jgi:hypothetical protein
MNNIASFARQAQTHLQTIAVADSAHFKRSHVYELMAAALGFGTHAALKAHGLLCPLPSQPLLALYGTLDPELCAARAEVLGIARKRSGPLAKALCADMAAQALGLVPWEDILEALLFGSRELYRETPRDDAYYEALHAALNNDPDAWPEDPEPLRLDSPFVCQALQKAAAQGEGRAHLALGLLIEHGGLLDAGHQHGGDDDDEDVNDVPDSWAGLYWYGRQQKGEVLTGVELEWAEGYAERVQRRAAVSRECTARSNSARDHFNAAAALGQHDALLLLADRYGDDRFFDLQAPQVRANPLWIADLAQRVGRYECTPAWLTVAAERGDMWAMRELMESWHADDPLQVWTWFYYAKLLGKDLTQGDYRAIHEDGSRYDDDVGGPMFVDGVDGVELPTVDEPMRQEAQRAAQSLFDRMKAD